MSFITLREWNSRQLLPRSMEQVRRWVREGKLYPAPFLDGRTYLIQENAVRIDPMQPKQFTANHPKLVLAERIRKQNKK